LEPGRTPHQLDRDESVSQDVQNLQIDNPIQDYYWWVESLGVLAKQLDVVVKPEEMVQQPLQYVGPEEKNSPSILQGHLDERLQVGMEYVYQQQEMQPLLKVHQQENYLQEEFGLHLKAHTHGQQIGS
jgi:hypothetical protein